MRRRPGGQLRPAFGAKLVCRGRVRQRGQRPKARLVDDYNGGDGKTFYVGGKKSEEQLRVYEEGREQGDRNGPIYNPYKQQWEFQQTGLAPEAMPAQAEQPPVGSYAGSVIAVGERPMSTFPESVQNNYGAQ